MKPQQYDQQYDQQYEQKMKRILADIGQERWDDYTPAQQRRILIRIDGYRSPRPPEEPVYVEPIHCCKCNESLHAFWAQMDGQLYCGMCFFALFPRYDQSIQTGDHYERRLV